MAIDGAMYEETNSFTNWFPFFLSRKFNLSPCIKT